MRVSRGVSSIVLAVWMAGAASAGQDFVTDLALCPLDPLDRNERGQSFDGHYITEIEWLCELETPLPVVTWEKEQTFFRLGYCNEPGAVYPGVFVFMVSDYSPNQLSLFHGDSGEPTVFHLCP